MTLSSDVLRPSALNPGLRDRLFLIYARHYEHISRRRFEDDLDAKDFVILLSAGGEPRGFSTQQLLRLSMDGRPLRAIFSGDTVIDRAYWGEQELVRGWCRLAGRVRAEQPQTPLYWFLITKGFRTYLYLPLFFREYYPRWDRPTPEFEQRLMHALGALKYPDHYRSNSGVVEFSGPRDCLAKGLAALPPGRRDDPRVRFYLSKNPRWEQGDELVSVAEISRANMKALAARMFDAGFASGPVLSHA